MTSEPRSLLGIGLKFPPSMDQQIIPREIAKAKSAGYNLEFYNLAREKQHDVIIKELKQLLESKNYSAISIGFGVRGDKELTSLFEKLVNTCVQGQPSAAFAFALLPDMVFEACERVLDGRQ